MRGFVKDYIVWIHHGETVVDVDQQEDDYLAQCVAQLDAEMCDGGHEQGGDGCNNEGGANNDGGGCVSDEVDDDNLEEILHTNGPEILLKSPKGLEKSKMHHKYINFWRDVIWVHQLSKCIFGSKNFSCSPLQVHTSSRAW